MASAQPAKYQPSLPEEIEAYRDLMWQREPTARVEAAADAERLVEEVGFCSAMTDARRPGPSLYIAVCGRRDAFMPRNVQKDPESSLTWLIKDEVIRRGRIYYAKLAKGRALFIAPRLVPHFNALYGVPRRAEKTQLSSAAQAVLKVLRREWEMATSDLRKAARIDERAQLTRALDELQRTMKVVPCDVLYEPWFTYIWMPTEARFAAELSMKVTRAEALREIARAYLLGAGQTALGELARVTGLSRPDAGRGNHALVAEGFATRLGVGVYRLTDLARRLDEFA